ncbi:MAG TPA: hypothetical protein VGA22_02510 [Gemmatimonadales bacterium]
MDPQILMGLGGMVTGTIIVVAVGKVITHWVDVHYRSKGAVGPASDRLERLEDRVVELQALAERVLEVEERVEFAERLLARGRAPGAVESE